MTDFLITAPDGTKYHVEGPAGATEQDALAQVQAQHAPRPMYDDTTVPGGQQTKAVSGSPAAIAAQSPAAVPAAENFAAGAGKAAVDLGRGAGQLVGAVSRQDVANARTQDAPLMATTAGKVGNLAGNVAALAPAAFIPGANTVTGAAAIGAATGFLQPSESTGETLKNVALGGVTAGVAQKVGGAVANYAGGKLAARQAASDTAASLNSDRDAVLQASRAAGYKVPPTAVNPSATNTALESVSGKAATRQAVSAANQPVTNTLIKQDLGIPAAVPATRGTILRVIRDQGQIYQQVKDKLDTFQSDGPYAAGINKLTQNSNDLESAYPGIGAQANSDVKDLARSLDVESHTGESAISAFKFLNERASANFKAARGPNGVDSQKLELGRAQSAAADEIGELIQRQLASTGDAQLAANWQNARVTIAKAYQALGALKGNNISAPMLAAQLQRGKPMTGGFKTVADFANHFKESAALPQSGVGVSKLGAAAAALELGTGLGGALFTHNPMIAAGGAAAAAMSAGAPYAARGAILSGLGQRFLATPNYAPSAIGTASLRTLYGAGRNARQLALGADAPQK